MKNILIVLALCGAFGTAQAEQTAGEKMNETGHDAGRAVKKGAHRAEEAVCAKSDTKCLAEKGKHRMQEGTEAIKDGAKSSKDKID